MVIFVHSAQRISGLSGLISIPAKYGQMGCQIFFVISALTLSISWYSKNTNTHLKAEPVAKFYKRRASAIVLPVWTAIFFWTIFDVVKDVLIHSPLREHYIASILCNALFINGLVPFANNWVYPGAWYIGTTVIFYLIVPFLFNGIRHLKTKYIVIFTVAYSVLWYAVTTVAFGDGGIGNNTFWYFNILNQMSVLLSGMILYRSWSKDRFAGIKNTEILLVITVVLDVFLFYCNSAPNRFALVPAVSGIAFSFLIICVEKHFDRIPAVVIRFFESFGNRSLSVLMAHGFFVWYMTVGVQSILKKFIPDFSGTVLWLVLIIPIYALSYYFAGWFDWLVGKERRAIKNVKTYK